MAPNGGKMVICSLGGAGMARKVPLFDFDDFERERLGSGPDVALYHLL